MARFEAGMESMVDMYIFETTSLLEQLDQILMKTENENSFGEEEINEIFRIMHTIKGSSAMMGLDNMSHLAHAIEDMFYIVREDKPVISDMRSLYDLVFTASDLLKAEIDLVQDEDSEPTDFSDTMTKIKNFAAMLKNGGASSPAAPASAPAAEKAAASAADNGEMITVTMGGGDNSTTVKVTFEEDCKMENLRALLVINNIRNECSMLKFEPEDIEDNSDTAKVIVENGFIIHFTPAQTTAEDIISLIGSTMNVKTCEVISMGSEKTAEVPAYTLTTAKVEFVEDCKMENLRALLVINNIREECDELAFVPSDIETNQSTAQTIRDNGFIIHFKSGYGDDAILKIIGETANVASVTVLKNGSDTPPAAAAAPVSAPAAPKAEEKAAPAPQAEVKPAPKPESKPAEKKPAENKASGGAKQSLISVNLYKLDQLLDMVGEIVITEAMVTSNPDLKGLRLDNFQKAARQLRKLNSELQDIVMSIRMVPISGAFNKMTRIVRDMKVKLNKDVDLVFEGEETEVDKSIIDNLNDPLMHMVRNSMDHGIEESAEDRIAAGKSPKGRITLSAYSSSGEVVIVVADDGMGMNPEKLLDKAERNGILTKPRSEYTEKEALNLIMLPGFSTNETVTEYSGRGVGMDVVRQNIEKCGGTVSVESKLGEGTSFIIKIPLSLSIVDGMEVSVGSSIFTIPISYIKESFKLRPNQILRDTDGREMVMIRGECYPLIRLYELYDLDGAQTDLYSGIIILVESDGKCACLLADELIGEQQVVVKPFPPLLNNFNVKQNGMSGCSILGDGSITIILDISNIISDF
ncbi:MAG: chemotaxis protein CheA [Oscillospiraceae bacterium]|nr:chemotaxis protein CheA [Oscillospiraceae bacterium]MDY6208209.1 chemotaxis protein CheA [Oscillospiraceae bacterium]